MHVKTRLLAKPAKQKHNAMSKHESIKCVLGIAQSEQTTAIHVIKPSWFKVIRHTSNNKWAQHYTEYEMKSVCQKWAIRLSL